MASGWRRAPLALLLWALLAYGYFVYRGPIWNADSRLALTYSLVERGTLDIDPYHEVTGDKAFRDGHYYSDKAPGISLLLAPIYAALQPFGLRQLSGELEFLRRYALTFLGLGVLSALFAVFLFHTLFLIEPRPWPRLLTVVGYSVGTSAWPFSATLFGHQWAAICLFVAFGLLWRLRVGREELGACGTRSVPAGQRGRDDSQPAAPAATSTLDPASYRFVSFAYCLLSGLLLGTAILVEYPSALPAAMVALYGVSVALHARQRVWLVAGLVPPLAVLGLYHTLAFGHPLATGYQYLVEGTQFAAGMKLGLLGIGPPDPTALWSITLSPFRGLYVYSPILLLAVPGYVLLWRMRAHRPEFWVCLAVPVALWLLNAGYVFWDGGASWGPRHLVAALPFLIVPVARAVPAWPRLAGTLVAASITLTLAGMATQPLLDRSLAQPLMDFTLPSLRSGAVANNWGIALGLPGVASLLPLFGAAGLIGFWLAGGVIRPRLILLPWAVGLVLALATLSHVDESYLDFSDGYFLYGAWRLLEGVTLYRDVVLTQPPLTFVVGAAALWLVPTAHGPRLVAVALHMTSAWLVYRIGRRLHDAPATAAVAAALFLVLPLGLSGLRAFDANALLVVLSLASAALALKPTTRRLVAGGAVGSAACLTKLTYAPVALAVLVWLAARRRRSGVAAYGGGLAAVGAAATAAGWAMGGPQFIRDGLLGELESAVNLGALPAGLLQFAVLEGGATAVAAWAWWRARRAIAGGPRWELARLYGAVSIASVLYVAHVGTFVTIARMAEPWIALFAGLGLVTLWEWARGPRSSVPAFGDPLSGLWQRPTGTQGLRAPPPGSLARLATFSATLGLIIAVPLALAPGLVTWSNAVQARWLAAEIEGRAAPGQPILAPPYFAFLARRPLLYEFPDATVWADRQRRGDGAARALAGAAEAALRDRQVPVVLLDFRLRSVEGVERGLRATYVFVARENAPRSRSVELWLPSPPPE